jgi:hypothetical protein
MGADEFTEDADQTDLELAAPQRDSAAAHVRHLQIFSPEHAP